MSRRRKKRQRKILLSPSLVRTLSAYLAVAEIYPTEEEKPLFITAKGSRLTRQGFWKNLKDRAIYSGIDKPLSPQTLRNSLALHLIEAGKDREEITKLLGNADRSSLRGYENRK
jgi:integrase/recombinase XerD